MKEIFYIFLLIFIAFAEEKTTNENTTPLKIERVKEMTLETFMWNHAHLGQPVIFEGLIDNWSALKKWDFNFFSKKYGDLKIPVFKNPGRRKEKKINYFI